jgi:hypothetical protein
MKIKVLSGILVMLISFFTISIYNNDEINQIISSFDLGISSIRGGLVDDGSSITKEKIGAKEGLISLFLSVPEIVKYKLFSKKSFENVYINIEHNNFNKILSDRLKAKQLGVLSNPQTVKANIRYKNRSYSIKLRLKGDLADHWDSEFRMSFRVSLKNNKTILGFNKFSIQKPRARQHPYDFTFQSLMRKVGNISPIHKYAHLYVNGIDWGIMDFEEHVSQNLLEKQKRKDSVIVRFSDERKWLYSRNAQHPYPYYRLSNPYYSSHLYSSNKKLKELINRQIFSYIVDGRMKGSKHLYDVNSLSKAYILSRIWGSDHSIQDSNSRYYFNPYTLKLEAITTDQLPWGDIKSKFKLNDQYKYTINSNDYLSNLDNNLLEVNRALSNIDDILIRASSFFPVDKKKSSLPVKENMRKVISDKSILLTRSSKTKDENFNEIVMPTTRQASEFYNHVYVNHFSDGHIELYNMLPDKVKVNKIYVGGESYNVGDELFVPSYFLQSKKPISIQTSFLGVHDKDVVVETEYKGFSRKNRNYITLVKKNTNNPLLLNYEIDEEFIQKSENGTYHIKSGDWVVSKPIVFDGPLNISSGTSIKFTENSYFVVKGALVIAGDIDKTVLLDSVEDSWKGIYVLDAKKRSHIKNTVIKNVSSLNDGLLQLDGGLTFYKSDVDINNLVIQNVKSKDAINIVDSDFTINLIKIEKSALNALSIYSSRGILTNSNFLNIGGSMLNFSGSRVKVKNINGFIISNEAVIASNDSQIDIEDSSFFDIGTGLISKNGGTIHASNVSIKNYRLHAAESTIGKAYYAQSSIHLSNSTIDKNNNAFIRQLGTFMSVDGSSIPERE